MDEYFSGRRYARERGTGAIFFINTGNAGTTRTTFLWMGQASGGTYGTWRTSNSGGTWQQVDKNEHSHGLTQIYQPDAGGIVFMAGVYSNLGWAFFEAPTMDRLGRTSAIQAPESLVYGTPKNLYSIGGGPVGIGVSVQANFEVGAQPGTGNWAMPSIPAGLSQGIGQATVVNDGTHNIVVGAGWNGGLWRYIEP